MIYRKYGKWSLAGWLNHIIFQWLFFRLQMEIDDPPPGEKGIAIGREIIGWQIIFPIVPLTGWKSGYIPQKYWTFKIL